MKNLIITLVVIMFVTPILAQKKPESRTKIIVASYNGYATDAYFFTNNATNSELKFNHVEPDVRNKFDLKSKLFVGKYFRVTYRIDFVTNEEQKQEGKLSKTQSAFKKQLTIIKLEELPDFINEEDEDDDGKRR